MLNQSVKVVYTLLLYDKRKSEYERNLKNILKQQTTTK